MVKKIALTIAIVHSFGLTTFAVSNQYEKFPYEDFPSDG